MQVEQRVATHEFLVRAMNFDLRSIFVDIKSSFFIELVVSIWMATLNYLI